MDLLATFRQDPLLALFFVVSIVLSLSLHELAHAVAAVSQGDETPRYEGRLSLNPLRHLDPLGTLMILIVGFGWARPVVTRPGRYRHGRASEFLVSSAGVLTNLALAVGAGLAMRFLGSSMSFGLARFLGILFFENILLAVFNALPIPPLDGSHMLSALVPGPLGNSLRYHANRSSYLLLVAVLLLRDPIGRVISAVSSVAARLLIG